MEEGRVRELLSFVANGIVKHQAILLGKAEATKKKKVISLSLSLSVDVFFFFKYTENGVNVPIKLTNVYISISAQDV